MSINWALENYNIAADPRSQGKAEAPKLSFFGCGVCGTPGEACDCDDYEGVDIEEELPWKWVLCPVCEGKGKHVNPAIDAGGLSGEMMDDVEFLEGYASGVYDVPCNRCAGRTTVPETDWDALDDARKALLEQQFRDEADWEAERLAEIRMGC